MKLQNQKLKNKNPTPNDMIYPISQSESESIVRDLSQGPKFLIAQIRNSKRDFCVNRAKANNRIAEIRFRASPEGCREEKTLLSPH